MTDFKASLFFDFNPLTGIYNSINPQITLILSELYRDNHMTKQLAETIVHDPTTEDTDTYEVQEMTLEDAYTLSLLPLGLLDDYYQI